MSKPKEEKPRAENEGNRFVWQPGEVIIREPTEEEKKLLEKSKPAGIADQ